VSGAPPGPLVENGPDEVDAGPCGEQRGDPGRIAGRRNLDEIDADDIESPGDLTQNVLAFTVGEAAAADRSGSRRDRRIETVDVDRDINALAGGNVAKPTNGRYIRSDVLRLVWSTVIATSRASIEETRLRRPD